MIVRRAFLVTFGPFPLLGGWSIPQPQSPQNMKSASPLRTRKPAGLTLLELTVVIAVLLALATVTMVGARAWKRGSDRAGCMISMRNIQASVRSYQNLYGYNPGTIPMAQDGTQSIADHLLAKGYIADNLHEMIKGQRDCPGGGTYQIDQEEVFPLHGELYVTCSFSSSRRHTLPTGRDW